MKLKKIKFKNFQKYLLLILLFFYFSISIPMIGLGSRNYSEVWSLDMDETILIPNVLRIINFEYPKLLGPYGNFPYFLCGMIFFPIMVFYKLNNILFSYSQASLMFHFTQILTGSLAIIYLYKIGSLLNSKLVSIMSILLVFMCSAHWIWILNIHSDIFQSTFLIISIFYLIEYQLRNDLNNISLILSAITIGFCIGSKFWGIFIYPAVLISIYIVKQYNIIKTIQVFIIYISTSLFTFFLFNLNIIFEFEDVIKMYSNLQSLNMKVGIYPFFLYKYKIANFTSPKFFGSTFVLLFIISGLYFIRQWKNKKDLELLPIFITISSFCIFYFFLYMDNSNTLGGERYIIGFVLLMIPPVILFIERLIQKNTYSIIGILLLIFVSISHLFRISGKNPDPLNIKENYESSSFFLTLNHFFQRENSANFQIRKWITSNVPKGSTIFVEIYMNITNNIEDNDDLPEMNIITSRNIDIKKVIKDQPDFVFSRYEYRNEDLKLLPNYIMDIYSKNINQDFNSKVYILKKKYEILNNKTIYNFYKNFINCKKLNIYKISAPWKYSLATLNEDNQIFATTDSTLQCEITISEKNYFSIVGKAGFWSGARSPGLSDGVRMKIDLITQFGNNIEIFNEYIKPEDELISYDVDLSSYRNQKLFINFYVYNDPLKNNNGDWVVWENPEIIKR